MTPQPGRPVVFLGPSLPAAEARAIDPDVIVLPPAGMGDLLSAVRHYRPNAVGLIDGTFKQNMSVFHKEILDVLSKGVWIVGASSMGALRAAEMDSFGMIGIGEIYGKYASGAVTDDDEVALTHAGPEFDHQPLSDPMVNIRATLERAVELGMVTPEVAAELAKRQKARFFPKRRLAGLLDDARSIATIDETSLAALADLIRAGGVNVKAADARLAIAEVRSRAGDLMPVDQRPHMTMSATFRATTERDVVVGLDDELPVTFDAIRRHCALNDEDFDGMWRAATSLAIIEGLAKAIGIGADEPDELEARSALMERLGCGPTTLDDTLTALDMTHHEFESLVRTEAIFIRMQRWLGSTTGYTQLTRPLINELRLRGRYEELRRQAGLFERLARQSEHNDLQIPLSRLMTIQSALTAWEIPGDLDRYIDANMLANRAELYDRLMVSVVALHELGGFPLEAGGEPADPGDVTIAPINTRGS